MEQIFVYLSCQCLSQLAENLFPIFIINAEENVKENENKRDYKYMKEKKVVDHVSFEIPKGKVIFPDWSKQHRKVYCLWGILSRLIAKDSGQRKL